MLEPLSCFSFSIQYQSRYESMLHQTKVLLDHALSQRIAGNWPAAIDLCRAVFETSVDERDLENLCESVLLMAHCYREMGEGELAIEQYELTRTIAELNGQYSRAGRALNGLGIVYQDHGEIGSAEAAYLHARELAARVGDSLTAGNIAQNLGTLANIRGDLTEALKYYHSSLACYESVGNERYIGGVLNNLGMLYIDLQQLQEASTCLVRALDVFRRVEDVVSESIVLINRTELFIEKGDLDQARSSCDEAFEIVSRLGEHSARSEALKFYGIIYRESGKLYLAETHLRESIEIAAQYKYPLQEAEAQRELARVLRAQERNREALQALNRARLLFSDLQARHEQADISTRVSNLESDFLSLVRMWGESIEAKDHYTSGHCQRVADYACEMAKRVGVPEQELTWFRMGAFLHDVGKTEVPEEILNKPGKLTPEERQIMEHHTVIGDEMLSPIEFPWDIRPMVRWHHERWDGNGYPDGLRGEEIPLTARIMRFADIFDALTTVRSYRQPLTPLQALSVMEDDQGGFDPDLFQVFRDLFPIFESMIVGADNVEAERQRLEAVGN